MRYFTILMDIRTDTQIQFPKNVKCIPFDGCMLWFAPDVATWIVTQGLHTEIVNCLYDGLTVHDTISLIVDNGISLDEACLNLTAVLEVIELNCFKRKYEGYSGKTENSSITSIHLSLTNKCNYKCFYCYMNAGVEKSKELKTNAIKKNYLRS